nr:hypothetical protein CFP56_37435 [Quercus suber]
MAVEDIDFSSLPRWIQVHDLPIEHMSNENAKEIGAMVGEVLEVDFTGNGGATYLPQSDRRNRLRLAWTAKNIGAGEIERHLRPAPPSESNHEKICIPQLAVHCYWVLKTTLLEIVLLTCHPSSLHHFKIHPISLYLKEIKNVVVGKSKNDNSIENQQIEAAYTSAKCFANVARLTK